uniref:Uncharacterized protein n=1 Tax=viral metagenome TaxID=1070528 RepID=A0A6M3L271_9ZZZZ
MRDLTITERNKLTIQDGRTGDDIVLYYRNPTSAEEVDYQNSLFKRKGRKLITNVPQTRITFALRIITGFGEGAFGYEGKEISADPSSVNYRSDWKDLLKACASDILSAFSQAIFEGTKVESHEAFDLLDAIESGEEEKIVPFVQS